jgi:hypothetical protein
MRLRPSEFSFLLAIGIVVGAIATTAHAGGSLSDRIYADSFGNLVIHSRTGYKRIVVGQGHLARELAEYEQPYDRDIVYLDESESAAPYECWKPAVLLKGRSYMYGLEDGELPDLPGKWCGGSAEHAAPGAALRRVQP